MFGLFTKKNSYDAAAATEQFRKNLISMAIDSTNQVEFDLEQQNHLIKIRDCNTAVKQYLPILKNHDVHIAIGFGAAMGALVLSAVIPFGLIIAMSGMAYGAFYLGKRDKPFNQFNTALEELALCCDWALSDISNSNKLQNDDIRDMLKTLVPLVTKEDLELIMGSEDEAKKLINAIEHFNSKELELYTAMQTTNAAQPLSKPEPLKLATKNDIHYTLYGYKQGGTLLTLINLTTLSIQKGFTYLWNLMFGSTLATTPDHSENTSPSPSV